MLRRVLCLNDRVAFAVVDWTGMSCVASCEELAVSLMKLKRSVMEVWRAMHSDLVRNSPWPAGLILLQCMCGRNMTVDLMVTQKGESLHHFGLPAIDERSCYSIGFWSLSRCRLRQVSALCTVIVLCSNSLSLMQPLTKAVFVSALGEQIDYL